MLIDYVKYVIIVDKMRRKVNHDHQKRAISAFNHDSYSVHAIVTN